MRKQDYLVQLIHSLTPNEKKHFRQILEGSDSRKSYGKLFDVLQKANHYDADAVSRVLKKSKKNLADDKEYLQEILLRSLHQLHSNSLPKAKVFAGLIEGDILANKGLVEFALAHIRKLKKGILPFDENVLYYLALAQEVVLVRASIPGGLKYNDWIQNSTDELVRRLESLIVNVKLVNIGIELQGLSADVRYITSKEVQDKAAALVKEVNELVREKALPSVSFISYHHLLSGYYFFLGIDTRRSIYHAEQMYERYMSETEQYRLFHYRNLYLIYTNRLQAYFELREFEKVETSIQDLKEYIDAGIPSEMIIKAKMRIFTFTILLDTATGKHTEALQFIQDSQDTFIKLRPSHEQTAVVNLLKAINLFHLQRNHEALSELLPLLTTDAPPQLPETRISARALNLMIQYEIGNLASLPNYLRAAKRFFINEELMTKEVKLFLDLMRHLHKHGAKAPLAAFQKNFEAVYDAHRFEIIGYFVIWP